MPVYDDQKNRGSTGRIPDDNELRKITSLDADQEAEAERRAYDEQAAGLVETDARPASNSARDILSRERQAAKGSADIGQGSGGAARSGKNETASGSKDESADSNTGKSLFRRESKGDEGFYHNEPGGKKGFKAKIKGLGSTFSSNKRTLIIGGSIAGGIGGIVAGIFGALLPYQIPSFVQFLEDKAYDAFNQGAEHETQRLVTSYIARSVLPAMTKGKCTSTLKDRHCSVVPAGTGPVHGFFIKLQQHDFEHNLALKGIEISSANGKFYMKSPSMGNPVDLADVVSGKQTNIFDMKEVSRTQVKRELKNAMEETGFFKKLIYRMKVGNLLKKHGIIRCLAACDFKDKTYGKFQDKKSAGLAYFNRRVLEPRSELLALYFGCLMHPCDQELKSDGVTADESTNGEPADQVRRDTRSRLSAYSEKFGADKLDKLVKNIEGIKKDGLTKYLIKQGIEKLGGKLVGKEISKELVDKLGGPVSWVIAVIRLVDFFQNAGHALKVMNYAANSALGVQTFEVLRTTAHEARAGHMDATMLGSMTNLLRHGPLNTGPGLEDSPIYDQTFASARNTSTAAFLQTILPQKAYAAAAGTSATGGAKSYQCNGSKGIFQDAAPQSIYQEQTTAGAASNIVCNEMRLSTDNIFTDISSFLQAIPGLDLILSVFHALDPVINAIQSVISSAVEAVIPQAVLDRVQEWGAQLISLFMGIVIKDPMGDKMSGARVGEVAIMGAEVGGQESAHRLLGGQVLSPADQLAMDQQQQQDAHDEFAALPLRDRLFGHDNTYTLSNQLALNMPSDLQSAARRSFASLLSNPMAKLADSFASLFTLNPAYAAPAVALQPNAFDIAPHGIPASDPYWKTDPVVYWDQNCADGKQDIAFNTAKADAYKQTDPKLKMLVDKFGFILDPRTDQVINPVANPCFMLEMMGKYDEPPAGGGGTAQTIASSISGNWKLTLPIGAPLEIDCPQLKLDAGPGGYQNAPYFVNKGALDFHVDYGGATTSGSKNSRSELREMADCAGKQAAWTSSAGTSKMTATFKVIKASPGAKTVTGQIHDASDDISVFRWEDGTLYITQGNNPHWFKIPTPVPVGTQYTVGFEVSAGQIKFTFNNQPIATPQAASFTGAYFKAGDYLQSNSGNGGKPGDFADVEITGLTVSHT